MKKVIFCTLLFFVFLLASCKNISNAGKTREPTDSKFAVINFDNLNVRAAASETYEPLKVEDEDIVRIEFIAKGIKDDGSIYTPDIFTSSTDSGTSGQIAWSGESCMENFKADSFLLFPGNYNFYLNIYTYDLNGYERLTLSAKLLNQTLEAGKTKTLTFTASYSDEGNLSITYQWPAKDRVGSVKMGLYPLDDLDNPVYGYAMTEIPLKEIEIDGESYFSALYNATELTNGVYWLKIQLYDTDPEFPDVIGNYLDAVSIYGYKTTGTKTLESSDYNQNYFIKYQLEEGQEIDRRELSDRHNQYEAVILNADAVKNTDERYIFSGWYTDSNLSEESKLPTTTLYDIDGNPYEVQIIALGTYLHTKDLTLYPKWDIIVAYEINIRGDSDTNPDNFIDIQEYETIEVEDSKGKHELDNSEENSWAAYFDNLQYHTYKVGEQSPFTGITSVKRRGFGLSWDVKYKTMTGESDEIVLDELPMDDCGTLTYEFNGEEQTVNDVVSLIITAIWQPYPVEATYLFSKDVGNAEFIQEKLEPDMFSFTAEKYNPYTEYCNTDAAKLLGSGYVLDQKKSTYEVDQAGTLKISNIFEPANYDIYFTAQKYNDTDGTTDESVEFNFYCTNVETGDGFFNIKKQVTDDPNYKNGDGTLKAYNAYVCLGIGRYAGDKLYLVNKYEYTQQGSDNKYLYYACDKNYTINFETVEGKGDFFEFKTSEINNGNTVKYKRTKQNLAVTGSVNAPKENYNNGALIITVQEDTLADYTVSNPAYLNQKPSLTFGLKHADGTEMASEDFISLNINLMQNNTLIESWNDKKPSNIYLYVNDENYDPHDPDAKLLNPANATQTIYLKSLPNAGTYQLYINVSYGYSDGMEYSGSYSTSFVVNDTLNYIIREETAYDDFTSDVNKDLKNVKGIVNVKITGENNDWGSSVPSFISEALSDYFVSIGDFFVNLDLSGFAGITEFSGLVNEKDGTQGTEGKLLTLKMPSTTTKIASDAVKGFGNLYTIELPASVSDIESNAFVGSGRKFILDENNETFVLGSNDTVILNKAGTNLYAYAGGSGKLIIPDGVTNLFNGIDTSNVESLYVPDSIEDIQSLNTSKIQELSINATKTSVSTTGTLTNTLPYLQKLTLRGNYTDENDFVAPTFPSGESPVGTNVAKLLAYCVDTLTDLTFDG
ncbi:MAG: leucine-rich repeat domain-containing protein, partial [Treponema sp.]|nr:leucine-rich repeat domain-containing protein [Treponema sp.]